MFIVESPMDQSQSPSDRPVAEDNVVLNACRASGKAKSNAKNSKKRKRHASDSEALIRKKIFGPAPILPYENSAEYELLLERHYADFKPKDIAMECYVHDGAYWAWQLRFLRRLKTCLMTAAIPNAMAWALGMPSEVRLRYIRGTKDADVVKPGDVHWFEDKPSEEEMQARVSELTENFGLMKDTIMTRAFLEDSDFHECIDRMIAIAESHRNAAYREIHRHRAALNYEEREKLELSMTRNLRLSELGKHRVKRHKKITP
jgi:hypothetical protein